MQGIVTIDLAVAPHVLIGGSTGSGKSVLLKNLLMQCVFKGSDVYIADFKGGLDFPRVWWEKTQVIIEPVKFLQKLQKIEAEMKHRIEVLRKADKRNLHDYNFIHSEYRYPRIVIACDEAAQLLDRTGRTKRGKRGHRADYQISGAVCASRPCGRYSPHVSYTTSRCQCYSGCNQVGAGLPYLWSRGFDSCRRLCWIPATPTRKFQKEQEQEVVSCWAMAVTVCFFKAFGLMMKGGGIHGRRKMLSTRMGKRASISKRSSRLFRYRRK